MSSSPEPHRHANGPAAAPISPSATTDQLRHMSSSLASPTQRPHRRTSQHLRTSDARLGSPSSIPSSPTSIHSSSSAIFERDIEPLLLPPSPPHPNRLLDPHRIPRARATEQLESSVPSVLDSAAAALTLTDTDVAVLAPLSPASLFDGRASGFASPLSLRSRSPSPSPRRPDSMLLSSVQPIARSVSGGSQIASPSSPPSPSHGPTKRLSFMSYSDLLTSTPASTHTLSSLTTSASTIEPPPHIPSVSGLNLASSIASASPSEAASLRGFSTSPGKRDSVALLDNVGGEWEREGLGKSLEERLEGETVGSVGGSLRGVPGVVGVVVGGKA
ncbi:hypothetical protein D9611_010065 [Ephemerocybe angulata]|uniref:Uncharacterized protein n=1 Tax=Ephemerocybe angulata TaxID=980116 RepID=A0A8H5AZ02_9AGAR|nr:hypothetical protein D9611_010065 [Tulosesus angulatus]